MVSCSISKTCTGIFSKIRIISSNRKSPAGSAYLRHKVNMNKLLNILNRRILFSILLSSCSNAEAQIASWNHTSYRVENGLPGQRVGAVQQDYRGFIWMLTAGGLCRFDGFNFDRLLHQANDSTSPPCDYITDLIRLPDNRMLATTTQGLYVFDPVTFRGQRIRIPSQLREWTILENITKNCKLVPHLKKIAVRSETSWIYYDYNLTNPITIRFPYPSNDLSQEMRFTNDPGLMDSSGNILTTTNYSDDLYLVDYEKRKMQKLANYSNHPYGQLTHYKWFDAMCMDSLQNLWFHCGGIDTLFCLPPYGRVIAYYLPKPLNAVQWYGQISLPQHDKMMWQYEYNGKAYLYELPYAEMLENPGIPVYIKSNTDISAYNYSLFTDKSRNTWIAHRNGLELVQANYKMIERIDLPSVDLSEDEAHWVYDLYAIAPDSMLIAANHAGLFLYSCSKNKIVQLKDKSWSAPASYPYLITHLIPLQGGRLLIRGKEDWELFHLNFFQLFSPRTRYEKLLVQHSSHCVFQDTKRNVWVGTDSGMLRFNRNSSSDTLFKNTELFDWAHVDCIDEDEQGKVWFANRLRADLYCYDHTGDLITRVAMPEASFSYISQLVCAPNNMIYLADVNGLGSFNLSTKKLQRYQMLDGFPTREIFALRYIHPFLIATTSNGCYFLNTTSNAGFVLNSLDGIRKNVTTWANLYDRKSNHVYLGGNACVYKIDLSLLIQSLPQPLVYIEQVRIENRLIQMSQRKLVLNPEENTISFRAKAVDFYSGPHRKFMYRIAEDGDTSAWLKHSGEEFLFNNLSSGHYFILLRSVDETGQWSQNIATLNFQIMAPWYARWWFVVLLVILPFGVLLALYQYKMIQYKKILTIRNQLSRDLHDDLGSTLSSINILSKQNIKAESDYKEVLRKIHERTTRLLISMKDIIWNIHPEHDQLEDILNHIRSYASEIMDAKGIEYIIDFPMVSGIRKVDFIVKHALVLITKEAVNNLVKYSRCNNARIEISIEGNQTLHGRISDDGIGFEQDKLDHIGGIHNIKQRAKEGGGYAALNSQPGKGTCIEFRLPL